MGNKQSSKKSEKKNPSRGRKLSHDMGSKKNLDAAAGVHDYLVTDQARKVDENYDISAHALASGSSTQIKRASSKRYHTKTAHTTGDGGVAIKLWDGKAEVPPDLRQEADILRQCDHANIIKLYEVAKVDRNNMSLVMELCTGGSLKDRLPYEEKEACRIMKQVCSAVAYLHKKYIVHRDIELSNILFENKATDSDVKIIDFGCATQLELVPDKPGAFTFLKEKTGSVHIMAPEVIKGRYGLKADVWSLGVVAFMLLNEGRQPFPGSTVEQVEGRILSGFINYKYWKHSSAAKKFCQKTIFKDTTQRLNADSALRHEWIGKFNKPTDDDGEGKKPTSTTSLLPNELVVSFDLFRLAPPLKRVALNQLARKRSGVPKYRKLFKSLDTTLSGTLTLPEFLKGFEHSGNSQEELKDCFHKLDIHHNNEVNYTEFLAATLEVDGELEESQLQEAFDLMGGAKKGYINKKNIVKICGEQTKEETAEMLQGKDKMTFEDFAQMFEHGFDARGAADPIIEMSLNEEQLARLTKEDLAAHMAAIDESK